MVVRALPISFLCHIVTKRQLLHLKYELSMLLRVCVRPELLLIKFLFLNSLDHTSLPNLLILDNLRFILDLAPRRA